MYIHGGATYTLDITQYNLEQRIYPLSPDRTVPTLAVDTQGSTFALLN